LLDSASAGDTICVDAEERRLEFEDASEGHCEIPIVGVFGERLISRGSSRYGCDSDACIRLGVLTELLGVMGDSSPFG